jgi:lysophospholipase L1-like esterase
MTFNFASISVIIGTVIGGGTVLGYLYKKVNKSISTWSDFIADWQGEEERDGRDAVPGVMARLNEIDGELKHNGGNSLKDVVVRLEQRLAEAEEERKQNHEILVQAILDLSDQIRRN